MFKTVTLGVMCLLIKLSLAVSTMTNTAAGVTSTSLTTLQTTVRAAVLSTVLSTDAQGNVLSEILPSQEETVVAWTNNITTIISTKPKIYAWTSWSTVHTATTSPSSSSIAAATSIPTLASTPTPSMSPNVTIIKHTNNTPVYVGAGVGSAAGVIAVVALVFWCYRRRQSSRDPYPSATLLTPQEVERREKLIRETQERHKKLREGFEKQKPVQKPRSILDSWMHRPERQIPEISHPYPQSTSQDFVVPAAPTHDPFIARPPRPASLGASTMRDMQDSSIPLNFRIPPEIKNHIDNVETAPRSPPTTPTPRQKHNRNRRRLSPSSQYSRQASGEPYGKGRIEYKPRDNGNAHREIITQDNLTERLEETILDFQSPPPPRQLPTPSLPLNHHEVHARNPYDPRLQPYQGREPTPPPRSTSPTRHAENGADDQQSIYEDPADDIPEFPYPTGAIQREDLTEANEFDRSLNRAQAMDVLEGDAGYSHRRAATEQHNAGARPQLGQARQAEPLHNGPFGSSMHGLRKIRD